MELTPIKIRGRHWRNRAQKPLAPTKRSTITPTTEAGPTHLGKRAKISKSKKKKIAAMPTLQGLPQELLEIIFLYSMNMSLPRASPLLGCKLSSRAVTMEYTMRSFFHTVDHRTNYRDRKRSSDANLQSSILACRFFTFDFFLAYVQRAHDAMVRLQGKVWEATGVQVYGVQEFDGLWPYKFTKVAYLAFAEGFHVPEKLLHGPWSKDKESLLYVLVSFGGEIDWEGSMAGEVAREGIKGAIRDGSEYAVAALSVLLGVPKAITTDMLRYAVIHCGCSIKILRHLLFNAQILGHEVSKEALDFYDATIWAWADVNGEKGTVLKEMLGKADAFDMEFYFDENVDWTSVVPFPYGGTKFDNRTALDEQLVQELLQNLYRNYGRKITRRRVMPFARNPEA
ncbi:hypothetical protein ACN47E_006625 [Coniothyrium glycines]